jgi:hypothetical protein
MKKIETIRGQCATLALACLFLQFLAAPQPARAADPFRQVVALAAHTNGATSGSVALVLPTYAKAVALSHVLWSTGAGVTNTLKVTTGSTTTTLGTKATSATDHIQAVTNAPWLFQSFDTLLLTSSATNAATAVLIGDVQ